MSDTNIPDPEALATTADEVVELRGRAEQAEQQRDEYLALLKAKLAEFENYQKRSARERDQERKYAYTPLVRDLLPALDNLDRALVAARQAEDEGPLVKGVEMVQKQLLDALRRHGVTMLAVVPGEPFDPERHDAVMQQLSAEYPAGTVMQVLQAGYQLHDRVLRHAGVVVSGGRGEPGA